MRVRARVMMTAWLGADLFDRPDHELSGVRVSGVDQRGSRRRPEYDPLGRWTSDGSGVNVHGDGADRGVPGHTVAFRAAIRFARSVRAAALSDPGAAW